MITSFLKRDYINSFYVKLINKKVAVVTHKYNKPPVLSSKHNKLLLHKLKYIEVYRESIERRESR